MRKSLLRDESGASLIIFAITIFVLLGFTGLVLDIGNLYVSRRQSVTAADAAALGAAVEFTKNNPSESDIRTQANNFATRNGAVIENLQNDVIISGSIVTVKVLKETDYIFARVLGFDTANVRAIASAGHVASNGLVPFGKVEGDTLYTGDEVNLKFEKWQDSQLGSGNYGYVRFPGQSGGDDLNHDISFGYEGHFPFYPDDLEPDPYLDTEPGHTTGPLVDAMETRMDMIPIIDGKYVCDFITYDEFDNVKVTLDNFYKQDGTLDTDAIYKKNCPLVVFIPVVTPPKEDSPNKGMVQVTRYASFLLSEITGPDNKKEVKALFIEYLTESELVDILGNDLKGAVINLIR